MHARVAHGANTEHDVAMAIRRSVQMCVFVAAPLVFQAVLLATSWRQGNFGIDFEQTLLPAAKKIASGESPYPAYGYPPLVAFGLAPLTFVPSPQVVFAVLLIASVPASLWFLGVRDWRCYGAAFLWAPVFSAVQTENVTLPLLLGIALCWHVRERRIAAVAGGLAIAGKILCWPLVVWLAATRRYRSAVSSVIVAVAVTLGLWATLGFSGLLDYPSSLRGLGEKVASESYTPKALAVDLGASQAAGRALGTALAVAILLAVVFFGRRGDDRRSFALAVVAMIVASPIVWLHSFALLLAAVAVLRPRFSVEWMLPAALVAASGTGNGAPWQTALVLVVAAVVVGSGLAHPAEADFRADGAPGRDGVETPRPGMSGPGTRESVREANAAS